MRSLAAVVCQRRKPAECPCGWGRHCRCLTAFRAELRLPELVRGLLGAGSDLASRRRAHAALREFMDLHDQRARDKAAIAELFRVLPRQKDVNMVRRLTCEDYERPLTDDEMAAYFRAPVAHVRDLRARIVATYEGKPLPVPQAWLDAAKARKKASRARQAARARRRAV